MATAEERRGPLVHRAVHHGAALWVAASLIFIAAMAVTQLGWSGPPAYSLSKDVISDLGNTGCGPWPHTTSSRVCSPWHDVFNVGIVLLGLLVILGAILVQSGFPPRRSSAIGRLLLAVGGIGAIGVGLSPENVNLTIHSIFALIAFLIGSLGLLVLGFAMFRDTRWDGYRAYTIVSGLVGLVATFLFAGKIYAGLGQGGMERLIVAPMLLWLIVASIHLLRIPQYAPRTVPT